MLIIGVTGGIGSGNSTVCECFKSFGVPVYDSDSRAKQLMNTSEELIAKLKENFGQEVFLDGQINREMLSRVVFSSSEKLELLNSIVHPAVLDDFETWVDSQNYAYVIMESAILIDSGFHEYMNYCIGVQAPLDLRVERVVSRDKCEASQVLKRIGAQLSDKVVGDFCDTIINNGKQDDLYAQVKELDEAIRYAAGVEIS